MAGSGCGAGTAGGACVSVVACGCGTAAGAGGSTGTASGAGSACGAGAWLDCATALVGAGAVVGTGVLVGVWSPCDSVPLLQPMAPSSTTPQANTVARQTFNTFPVLAIRSSCIQSSRETTSRLGLSWHLSPNYSSFRAPTFGGYRTAYLAASQSFSSRRPTRQRAPVPRRRA